MSSVVAIKWWWCRSSSPFLFLGYLDGARPEMQFIVNPDLFPGFCASFVVNSVDRNSSSSNSSGEKMRPLWHDGPEDNDATLTAAVGSTPKCYWGGQKKVHWLHNSLCCRYCSHSERRGAAAGERPMKRCCRKISTFSTMKPTKMKHFMTKKQEKKFISLLLGRKKAGLQ